MWLLLIMFVVDGNLDFSYRLHETEDKCIMYAENSAEYITTYHNRIEHFEVTCIKLEE